MNDPNQKIPLRVYRGFMLFGDPRVSNIGTLEPVSILQPNRAAAEASAREIGILLLPDNFGKGVP